MMGRNKLIQERMDVVVMEGCEELGFEWLGEINMGMGLWYGEALGPGIWGSKCFQHKGGGAHACKGNCRAPEVGGSVDSSGKQESREGKHIMLN